MSYCAEKIGLLKGFTNADRSWASDKACDDFRRKKRAILKSLSLNFFSNTALDTEPIQFPSRQYHSLLRNSPPPSLSNKDLSRPSLSNQISPRSKLSAPTLSKLLTQMKLSLKESVQGNLAKSPFSL